MSDKLGFQNSIDASMFYKFTGSHVLLVLGYPDHILVTGSDKTLINQVMKDLNHSFSLKDLGDTSFFLGIQVVSTQNLLHLRW